jgi:hypothetical protein
VDKKIAVVSYKKLVEFTLQNSLGLTILQSRGIFTRGYWYWLGAAALVGYIVVFNILVTFALGYFEPLGRPQALVPEELLIEKVENRAAISKRDKSTLPSSVHASSAANGAGAGTRSALMDFGHCSRLY